MNPIDDMFRKGLDGRSGEVPADMWSRVQAGQTTPVPEGAELDKLFADGLKDHAGQVPANMWSRIAATGLPAAAAVDQVFADGLKDRVANVPAGMWDKIWKARAAAPRFNAGRWASAAAVILLLLLAGWWLLPGTNDATISNEGTVGVGEPVVGEAELKNNEEEFAAVTPGENLSLVEETLGGDAERVDVEMRLYNETAAEDPESVDVQVRLYNEAVADDAESTDVQVRLYNKTLAGASESTDGMTPPTTTQAEDVSKPSAVNTPLLDQTKATAPLALQAGLPVLSRNAGPSEIKVKGRYRPKPSNDRAFRAAPRHRFQTELLFGAAYADQQLTPATDADRTLSSLREVSEFPELSYQVSLRGAYNLNERLLFLGGLTYAEIRNQFEYERTVAGETSLIRTNNSLRMLEAPLLLGYRMPGRRLQVSLNLGPVVNLSTSARGRFLDPDSSQPLDLATEGNYRRNIGVGFMTSLSTTYQIGKKEPFVLLVEPFFKAYPTAFTTRNAPVKESYWVAGLQLGVRKGF